MPKRKKRPILLELEYVHPGCFCIDAAEKIEGARIRGLSVPYVEKGLERILMEFEAPDVNALIKHVSKNPVVKKVDVIRKAGNWALVDVTSKPDALLLPKLLEARVVPALPSATYVDRDFVSFIVPSDADLRKLSSLLKEDAAYWVRSKKYLDASTPSSVFASKDFLRLKLVTEQLPPQQRDAFVLAVRRGYYEIPKKTTLEELAKAMGVSPSTFAEHLRKAEAKFLPFLADALSKASF
ncbi:MAG: helix-turn-helix domain-containing protein [Candidatus Micrarchaeota archaeon]